MIRINLLPVRQTRKIEALRREVALASVLGAAIIGGFVLIWAGLGIRLQAVRGDNTGLDLEIAKLAEDVKRVDAMEKYKAELQRKLEVGYNRAARMIERMEIEGIVGASDGVRPRPVLVQQRPPG
jgi:DNA segregation ATPase FtsK/SpoIIIE-like protein